MAGVTDWRGWLITDTQADLIRRGDIPARNNFYFDNYNRIKGMAFNYAYKNPRCCGMAWDMVSCLYVDFGYFKQANGLPVVDGLSLSRFVIDSFRFCPFGGLLYLAENNAKMLAGGGLAVYSADCLSLERPFGRGDGRHQDDKNARTLSDIIPAPDMFDCLEIVDLTDELKTAVADLLTPRGNEYFGYFIEGYANAEISRRMGYKTEANNADRVREKLRENAAVILARLAALGVVIDYYQDKTPYDPKKERTYKISPEKRAYYRENMRKQRERKRALMG